MKQNKNTLFSLFLFTLPSIISSMIEPISGIVDTALIGRLNTDLLGALSIGITLIATFTYVFNFIVHTTTSSISNIVSLKDHNKINQQINLTIFSSLFIGILASIFLYFFRGFLYQIMGVSKSFSILVDHYFEIRSLGHFFVLLYISLIAVIRGKKNVQLAFYIILFTTLLNVVLSYFLINYFSLGLKGAALGTVCSNIAGVLICFIIIFRDHFRLSFKFPKLSIFDYSKDSIFLFIRSLFLSFCFFYSTRQANLIGKNSLAAYQILINLWLFVSFFIDGIAVSATILFAESRGLKDELKMKTDYILFIKLTVIIGSILSLIYFIFPQFIFSIFTTDQNVKIFLYEIWPMIVIFQIPNSIAFMYDGILFGFTKFKYLGFNMIIGCLLFAYPILFFSLQFKSLKFIFYAHIALNVYRLVSCHIKIYKLVFSNSKMVTMKANIV